jgi:hypothetical protein
MTRACGELSRILKFSGGESTKLRSYIYKSRHFGLQSISEHKWAKPEGQDVANVASFII